MSKTRIVRRKEMRIALLAFVLALLLFAATPVRAIAECPDGQVRWDAVANELVYAVDDPNAYKIYVSYDEGGLDWWSCNCNHCFICVSYGDHLEWLVSPDPFGSALNADHIVWWGSCQIPCPPYPPELLDWIEQYWHACYLPFVMGGEDADTRTD